jgi:hypothetical protein
VFNVPDDIGQTVSKVFNPMIFASSDAFYLTCERSINYGLRLDFSGAAADFCLTGFSTVVHDENPSPTNVDINRSNNIVGNTPIYHRKAPQKLGG